MNTAHLNVFSQGVGGGAFSPLDLNPITYVRSWEGVNESGGNLLSLTDLTGNGYDFTPVATPLIVPSGINGLQSIEFTGANYLQNLDVLTQRVDLSKIFYWIVYKPTNATASGSYHTILIIGSTSFNAAGSTFSMIYNLNSSNNVISNFAVNSLDGTVNGGAQLNSKYAIVSKSSTDVDFTVNGVTNNSTGAQNVANQNIYIGDWNGNGAKMLFSEFGMLTEAPDAQGLADLKQYFTDTYNL